MSKQVIDSFQKGFSLTNKSWSLFLLALSLTLLDNISSLLENSFIGITLQVAGFLLILIYYGFSFSLPIFLVYRQQGKSLSFGKIVSTTLLNTKRLMLFTILILLFMFIGGLLSLFLIAIFLYGGNFYFMQNLPPGLYFWDFMLALIIGLCSFFTFAPIYFSLEKNGVLSSIKKSVSFSFKNLNFIMVIFVISVSTYLVLALFLNNHQNLYQLFIRNTIYAYELLLISAASLIFYQNQTGNIKSNSQGKEVVAMTEEIKNIEEKPIGKRKHITAILLSIFLGHFGIDRFYMGLIGTGILKLLTFGGCGIWTIIDWILIATNNLKDGDGKYLQS